MISYAFLLNQFLKVQSDQASSYKYTKPIFRGCTLTEEQLEDFNDRNSDYLSIKIKADIFCLSPFISCYKNEEKALKIEGNVLF